MRGCCSFRTTESIMKGVYSNSIFFVVLCENFQRLIGALEQNLMLFAFFIKYSKVYVFRLLYTFAAV